MKFGVLGILVVVSLIFHLYESRFDRYSANINAISTHFNRGDNLKCNGVDVNNTNFIYLEHTSIFLAKDDVLSEFKGLKFDAKNCKIVK